MKISKNAKIWACEVTINYLLSESLADDTADDLAAREWLADEINKLIDKLITMSSAACPLKRLVKIISNETTIFLLLP